VAKLRVGYIGVGLGHGAAKNILQHEHHLVVMGHRNREPVDDLVRRGAREAETPADVASESDIVSTCLPSSLEVEKTIFGRRGVLEALRPGMVYVDSTTADPSATRRIGGELAARGIAIVDAPVGRTR
jgi:3-hydroxyisobutyrate dehydrogenase-like beta-hydroxyacid dehydrogenase